MDKSRIKYVKVNDYYIMTSLGIFYFDIDFSEIGKDRRYEDNDKSPISNCSDVNIIRRLYPDIDTDPHMKSSMSMSLL